MISHENIIFLLALLLFCTLTFAALPNCAPGVKCPPGGIWGEWTTVGDGICKMDCGSCAQLAQTRECMSSEIPGCECIGSPTRSILCNMKTCLYPSQRTCCIPYLPMIINGSSVCGPLPKSMTEPDRRCCPIGGIWSEYSSGYTNVNNEWVRTRRCLSASVGCPCSGSETEGSSTCPCPLPTSAMLECPNPVTNGRPGAYEELLINHKACTATLAWLGNNDVRWYCSSYTGYAQPYQYASLFIMNEVNGGCTYDYPFDCSNRDRVDQKTNISFTCDTDSLYWIYDYTGKHLKSYAIGVYNSVIPL
ncbi:unnamed protein product [Caenorhabditis brenneri]